MCKGEHNFWFRAISAAFVGLISIGAACGAALPDAGGAGASRVEPSGAEEADPLAKKSAAQADGGAEDPSRCPYGALEDPHRGFVRCLKPEERDAGWLPPPPQNEPEPDAGVEGSSDAGGPPSDAGAADAGAKEEKAPPAPPPLVRANVPKFEGGEVPRAEKFVNGLLDGIGKCVAENGGLKGDKGSFTVTFLVRARGRAEGVEVSSAKGIGADAAACIRVLLKNKAVGAPSADPVGVTVTISLEKGKS